mgnify:CR=1 FL=1|jgi:hypothetical protein
MKTIYFKLNDKITNELLKEILNNKWYGLFKQIKPIYLRDQKG